MTDTMPGLATSLERAIRGVRAEDPLRRVTVVVPNHILGVWLSRSIFADTGHMAIDFVRLRDLAWVVNVTQRRQHRAPDGLGA